MVVIATWNLENLFLPGEDSGRPPDRATYDAKLDALAGTIDRAAIDVLAVQEVGDPEAAADLAARLGDGWTVHLSQLPDQRGIRVGVLSTRTITETEDLADFPAELGDVRVTDDGDTATRMRRGAFRAQFETPGAGPVDVVTCHLKSKLLTYPGGRFRPRGEGERARYGAYALYLRAAEATTVRTWANRLLDGEGEQRSIVVCGDLNDEPRASTTQILLGPGGSEIGTPGEERPDQGDAWRLWNTAPLVPQERRYSRVYRGRHELIDQILVSHELLQHVGEVDSLVDRALPSVNDTPTERAQAPDSDHAPVVATFDID